jgi:hypothetical protein
MKAVGGEEWQKWNIVVVWIQAGNVGEATIHLQAVLSQWCYLTL